MANSLYDFATSEASNSTTGGVNTAENQAPSTVNDAMRAWKQLEAAWLDDLGGIATVGGTSTAITVTLSQGFTAYGTGAGQIPNGAVVAIKAGSDASGATTLNINGIGTKAIRRQGDSAIVAKDWLSGSVVLLRYDTAYNGAAGAWVLLNRSSLNSDLGTPTALTLTNATGLPISTGVSGLGSGVATFLATPSSANLRSALTDETGTGKAVFADAPTLSGDVTLNTPANTGLRINSSDGTTFRSLVFNTNDTAMGIGTVTNHPIWLTTNNTPKVAITAAGVLDLSVGSGVGNIKFPATQSASADANTLDDYERGTWTPTYTSTGATFNYLARSAAYVKVGRSVTYDCSIVLNTSGNTLTGNPLRVASFPFTQANGNATAPVKWALTTSSLTTMMVQGEVSATTFAVYGATAAATSISTLNSNQALHATNGTELTFGGACIASA